MWVITLDKKDAFNRVKLRNPNFTEEDINNRLARQITDEERLQHAKFYYSSSDPFEIN